MAPTRHPVVAALARQNASLADEISKVCSDCNFLIVFANLVLVYFACSCSVLVWFAKQINDKFICFQCRSLKLMPTPSIRLDRTSCFVLGALRGQHSTPCTPWPRNWGRDFICTARCCLHLDRSSTFLSTFTKLLRPALRSCEHTIVCVCVCVCICVVSFV